MNFSPGVLGLIYFPHKKQTCQLPGPTGRSPSFDCYSPGIYTKSSGFSFFRKNYHFLVDFSQFLALYMISLHTKAPPPPDKLPISQCIQITFFVI